MYCMQMEKTQPIKNACHVNSRHWNQSICVVLRRHRHCSVCSAAPLDNTVAIQRARTLARNDLRTNNPDDPRPHCLLL
jgi:hypothetical protein